MSYVQGFLTPCPTAKKAAYRAHAESAVPMFKEFGALRMVEGWADDVPAGKLNDLHRAVDEQQGETVLFSFIEYPDRATCDAAAERMMTDPRMEDLGDIPFDAKRMMWGGFAPIVDEGSSAGAGYIDGFVLPVPDANRAAYRDLAEKACAVFRKHGVLRYVEAWGEDVPRGKQTDFWRASHAQDGESVVFSWCEWPDKATRDAGWAGIMADPLMAEKPTPEPFDGKRMMYGGFAILVDA